ncbi:RxLR effector protein PSR2 [Phytophthora ramorum]|uniref:RxLR effector PexRD54 WY domain-containing protein n=2 Tax=Phytophthora ramorum TaxID=164328 RepID=H3H5G8_PHYRM|nr:RxLR effector protein PSR2 [Phytophthora ramorum]
MRLHCVLLLAAVVATADAASVVNAKLATSHSTTSHNTKRFLRTVNTADENDEERGINFKAIPGVEAIKNVFSKKVTLENLLAYADKKKPSDYIFKKLNLNKVDSKLLFDNSDFNVWVAYVRLIDPRHAEAAMITSLTARYGDEALAKMIQAASTVDKTKTLAKLLEAKQLEGWKTMGLSNNGVFKLLQLNRGVDNLLVNPNLSIWVKYMNYLGKNGHDDEAVMIKTFMAHYSDKALSQMLTTAKKVPDTKVVATKLQTELLGAWQTSKKTPEDVFKLLQLDKAVDGILTNPMLRTWMKYMDDFNLKNPDKETTVIKTFMTHYSDDTLAPMLMMAKKVPATNSIATKLQSQLFDGWLIAAKSPEDVLMLLKLDLDGLLTNPMLNTWTKYLDVFNVRNPTSRESMIEALTKTYTDEALTTMIMAAKGDQKTAKFATDLQSAQLKNWLSKAVDQRTVFKLFDVKKTDADNPYRAIWLQYVRDYNQKWVTNKT